jgi:putative SOS response-associated peptidase YedK
VSQDWLRTFTVLACKPNKLVAELHDRMRVIIAPEHHERWLKEGGKGLLKSYPAERITPIDARTSGI